MTPTKTDLKASGLEVIGYRGIFPNRGKYIPADEALEYALEQCGSGNWIPEYGYPEGGRD